MKRLLGILAITALAASAFAQGTVILQNQTGLVQQWTSVSDSTLINVPKNGGYVELLSAPAGTALANSTLSSFSSLSGFMAANPGWSLAQGVTGGSIIGFGAGLFNGGTLSLTGIAGGAPAEYIVAGWTGAFPTYDAAYAAALQNASASFIGLSAIDTVVTGNPSLTPPGLPVGLRPTFTGMTTLATALAPIPEPTSFALAGLGLAALLVFRRRS